MVPENVVNELTGRISVSVDRVIKNRNESVFETEPNLTDRLLANIERDFETKDFPYRSEGIKLTTRTLRDRGANAPENIWGADLATLLDIQLDDYKVNKGFLAQSKWVESATVIGKSTVNAPYSKGNYFVPQELGLENPTIFQEKSGTIEFRTPKSEIRRMKEQCINMLSISPDSFVFLYCSDDIYVVPANAIVSNDLNNTQLKLYCKNFKLFMADYLKSFIGDNNLNGISDDDFKRIQKNTRSRALLYMQIEKQN